MRSLVEGLPGVERVYGGAERRAVGLDHVRSGELIAMADARSWFTYYYWNDDRRAPDFARTVEIHRKPGYDPVELFLDPAIAAPKAAIGKRLLLRKLGFRTLMDVIPLDASLVRGSHGRLTDSAEDGPLVITDRHGCSRATILLRPASSSSCWTPFFERGRADWGLCVRRHCPLDQCALICQMDLST